MKQKSQLVVVLAALLTCVAKAQSVADCPGGERYTA